MRIEEDMALVLRCIAVALHPTASTELRLEYYRQANARADALQERVNALGRQAEEARIAEAKDGAM